MYDLHITFAHIKSTIGPYGKDATAACGFPYWYTDIARRVASLPKYPPRMLAEHRVTCWSAARPHLSRETFAQRELIFPSLIVPVLTPGQQHDVSAGRLLLDQMTRDYIRGHFSYREIAIASRPREADMHGRASSDLPQPHCCVVAGGGEQVSVRAERHPIHTAGLSRPGGRDSQLNRC